MNLKYESNTTMHDTVNLEVFISSEIYIKSNNSYIFKFFSIIDQVKIKNGFLYE